jgi:hypothetical protein
VNQAPSHQTDDGQAETHALRKEVARLRVENEQLRSHFRVAEPKPPEPQEKPRPIRVLLFQDPLAQIERGKLGPEALTNLARTVISTLSERQPDAEWRAEHDLAYVSDEAECFQLGQVLGWMFGGPLPMTFRVKQADDGPRCIQRCLIAGEPDSDRFSDGYQRRLGIADELLMEGQAAYRASAEHHAGWTLKAVDLVLAQLKLAMVSFQIGRRDWRELLDTPRPEYDPRYEIEANQPVGW